MSHGNHHVTIGKHDYRVWVCDNLIQSVDVYVRPSGPGIKRHSHSGYHRFVWTYAGGQSRVANKVALALGLPLRRAQ